MVDFAELVEDSAFGLSVRGAYALAYRRPLLIQNRRRHELRRASKRSASPNTCRRGTLDVVTRPSCLRHGLMTREYFSLAPRRFLCLGGSRGTGTSTTLVTVQLRVCGRHERRGVSGNDLIYIPRSTSEMTSRLHGTERLTFNRRNQQARRSKQE